MDFAILSHDLVLILFLSVKLNKKRVGKPTIPHESSCIAPVLIQNIVCWVFVNFLYIIGES